MISIQISRLLLLFLVALQVEASSANMDPKILSSAVAKFSARFCNELDKSKSVVASPLSAEYVLALLTLGSTNEVHTELLKSLGIPDDDTIRTSFTAVSSKLKTIKGVTLNVANKVYVMEGGHELNPKLKEDAEKVFDAGIEKLDFSKGAHCANLINKWVESKTNNRIKDLLSGDSLDASTRLVLVNALYFKGTWKKQFDPHHTHPQPFHIEENKRIDVPMMYREDTFDYGESADLGVQILKLPYVGDEASMVIVLPAEINGLDAVLQKLANGHDLIEEINKLHKEKVQVTLPKFKIETEIDLNTLLPKLGISEIFNKTNTGLTNLMTEPQPLYVSKAVQKAFIEVNEEGAEAAAATAMKVRKRRALPDKEPIEFKADRRALWCLLVDDHVAFVARYQPQPAFRDEL